MMCIMVFVCYMPVLPRRKSYCYAYNTFFYARCNQALPTLTTLALSYSDYKYCIYIEPRNGSNEKIG